MNINTQKIDSLFEKAVALYLDNKLEEAESLCLEINHLEPLTAKNLNLLGLINYNLQNFDQSIAFLQSATELDKQNLDYLICLGDVYLATHSKKEAENYYLKAKTIAPENQEIKEKLLACQAQSLDSMAIICCHGWSGSNWLATALNLHEKIICTHSARNLLSDGVVQNLKATVIKRAQARSQRIDNSLASILEGIKSYGTADIYACVHTLRARDLTHYLLNPPENTSMTVSNLIRNPISVVNSGFGQLSELVAFDIFTLNEVTSTAKQFAEAYYEICEKYQLSPCDLENLCFFDACSHLRYLQQDIPTASSMYNIQMERIVSEPEYFAECFTYITDGLSVNTDYLNQVFKLGKINPHKKGHTSSTAEQKWLSWTDWQQAMFRYFFNSNRDTSFLFFPRLSSRFFTINRKFLSSCKKGTGKNWKELNRLALHYNAKGFSNITVSSLSGPVDKIAIFTPNKVSILLI